MKMSHRLLRIALGVMTALLILFIVLVLIAAGPAAKTPSHRSGNNVTQSLDLSGFDAVEVEGVWRITVRQSDTFRVHIVRQEGRAGLVNVRVSGDTLILRDRRRWWDRDLGELKAEIGMPSLEKFRIQGVAEADIRGFDQSRMEIVIEGAVGIETGDSRTDHLDVVLNGLGDADLRGIVTTDAEVSLEGAGEIRLTMNGGVLSGVLDGMGTVRYQGPVREERVHVDGMGSVKVEL